MKPQQQWPSVWYHLDFPLGRMFQRPEDVPQGAVPTPALIGLDTEFKPIPGWMDYDEGEPDNSDDLPPADAVAPKKNKGGRPRKVRVDE